MPRPYLNPIDLAAVAAPNNGDIIPLVTWLQQHQLIPEAIHCNKAPCINKRFHLQRCAASESVDQLRWRCKNKHTKSIRSGTVFQSAKLPLWTIVQLMMYWSLKLPQAQVKRMLDISNR